MFKINMKDEFLFLKKRKRPKVIALGLFKDILHYLLYIIKK